MVAVVSGTCAERRTVGKIIARIAFGLILFYTWGVVARLLVVNNQDLLLIFWVMTPVGLGLGYAWTKLMGPKRHGRFGA